MSVQKGKRIFAPEGASQLKFPFRFPNHVEHHFI